PIHFTSNKQSKAKQSRNRVPSYHRNLVLLKAHQTITKMAGARKEMMIMNGTNMSRREGIWETNSKKRASKGNHSFGFSPLFLFYFLQQSPIEIESRERLSVLVDLGS
ncbi:uncharacterized protein LOC132047771, partial [Lycium ferocissimum]|uniref:uncharacterized protein LOC132047771 n=1 Tax=Lycium ferocissimum TaxID=112874 RepID=UPI0028164526